MLKAKVIKSPKLKIRNPVHEERKHFPQNTRSNLKVYAVDA